MSNIITVKQRKTPHGFESLDIYVNNAYLGNVFTDGSSIQTTTHTMDGRVSQFKIVENERGGKMFTSLFYAEDE